MLAASREYHTSVRLGTEAEPAGALAALDGRDVLRQHAHLHQLRTELVADADRGDRVRIEIDVHALHFVALPAAHAGGGVVVGEAAAVALRLRRRRRRAPGLRSDRRRLGVALFALLPGPPVAASLLHHRTALAEIHRLD